MNSRREIPRAGRHSTMITGHFELLYVINLTTVNNKIKQEWEQRITLLETSRRLKRFQECSLNLTKCLTVATHDIIQLTQRWAKTQLRQRFLQIRQSNDHMHLINQVYKHTSSASIRACSIWWKHFKAIKALSIISLSGTYTLWFSDTCNPELVVVYLPGISRQSYAGRSKGWWVRIPLYDVTWESLTLPSSVRSLVRDEDNFGATNEELMQNTGPKWLQNS